MSQIILTLTADEALVLLDWLAAAKPAERPGVDQAVRRALWNLEASLEARVPAVVADDYRTQVAAAMRRLAADD